MILCDECGHEIVWSDTPNSYNQHWQHVPFVDDNADVEGYTTAEGLDSSHDAEPMGAKDGA